MAFSRFLSFGKLFVHVFVTTKYGMKEEKVQVGVQSRERKSIGKDGRGQLHEPPVPPEPSLGLPEATAGEGWYSPHFFCVRLHLNATLWTHWNLCFLPSEHPAPGTSLCIACHSSSQLLVFFPPLTPVLFSTELCSLVPAPGRWPINVGRMNFQERLKLPSSRINCLSLGVWLE